MYSKLEPPRDSIVIEVQAADARVRASGQPFCVLGCNLICFVTSFVLYTCTHDTRAHTEYAGAGRTRVQRPGAGSVCGWCLSSLCHVSLAALIVPALTGTQRLAQMRQARITQGSHYCTHKHKAKEY